MCKSSWCASLGERGVWSERDTWGTSEMIALFLDLSDSMLSTQWWMRAL